MELEFGNLEQDIKTYFEQLNERLNDRKSKIDVMNNSVFKDDYFPDRERYIMQWNENVIVLSVFLANDRDEKKYIAKVII